MGKCRKRNEATSLPKVINVINGRDKASCSSTSRSKDGNGGRQQQKQKQKQHANVK